MTTTSPGPPAGPTPTTLTARTPEDVLAIVPVVLGFVPHDSVVMLTFGAARPFHARVDLPADRADVPEMVSALVAPARRHRARRLLFVVYTTDAGAARHVWRALRRACDEAGIDVVDALRADASRWFALAGSRPEVPERGVPYDVSAHPFLAQSVVDGRVTHGSRAALAATLRSDPDAVREVQSAVQRAVLRAQDPEPGDTDPQREAAWVSSSVARHVSSRTSPDAADAARLLTGLRDLRVRDAAWLLMSRESARDHVGFWTDVVRRAPAPLLCAPAALLGFAAWLSGHGALAWCALDRCLESDPDYTLAHYLAEALTQAVPPTVWEATPPGT